MEKWDHCNVVCDELDRAIDAQEELIRVEKQMGEIPKEVEKTIEYLNNKIKEK